jgi:hypothetical protein
MDRIRTYALIAAELDHWQRMPRLDLLARLDRPAEITSAMIGDTTTSLEVSVRWEDESKTKLRVQAIAYGPSTWKMERLEEAIILELLDTTEPDAMHKS